MCWKPGSWFSGRVLFLHSERCLATVLFPEDQTLHTQSTTTINYSPDIYVWGIMKERLTPATIAEH